MKYLLFYYSLFIETTKSKESYSEVSRVMVGKLPQIPIVTWKAIWVS